MVFSLDPAPAGARYRVTTPEANALWARTRAGRVYGFAGWVARQTLSCYDAVHAMGDNHMLGGRVVRTLSGSALAEAKHARRLKTRLMFLSVYPLELIGAARAAAAVGISMATLDHFPGVQEVIPEGIDLKVFRPSSNKSEMPVILSVGHQLHDRKRLDLVVEAFRLTVRPALPESELWIVASEEAEGEGIRNFRDLTIDHLAALFRQAWIFCLPSSYEGFGRPYAEALASGTPVVATPNPGAMEVLEGGGCGLIVQPASLGQALLDLLGDPDRRAEMAGAGLRRASEFDWERVTERYEELYRKVAMR
jgi:glycosyltransferase involved in cell wall biosynthesis